MAKYRLLTQDELNELEKEFIDYLILNGIAADDWEKMKKDDNEAAENILALFSDVVFEGIMRKVKYLEYRSKNEIKVFQCLEKSIVLVGMKAENKEKVDFTDPKFIREAAQNSPEGLKVYTTEKKYIKQREIELFEMVEAGCTITDDKLFVKLCLVLPSKN